MRRRDIIKYIGAVGLTSIVHTSSFGATNKILSAKKSLQIAHITDTHLTPDDNAPKRFAELLHHIQDNYPNIDFIINTGDSIIDALTTERSKVDMYWKLWNSVLRNENSFRLENCIGNHDIWATGSVSDKMYGKKLAMEALKMDCRYRSFNNNGWHFIVLDSTQINSNGEWYTAYIDDEQLDWLISDLNNTPQKTPVIIMSHIPFLSASPFFVGDSDSQVPGFWHFPHEWMHGDTRKMTSLFSSYSNVKLVVSGHMHMVDRVDYNGISYLCNGSVCAKWWKGEYHGHKSGYAIIDLFDDGSFENKYVSVDI